jgi:hypothetical protein
MIAHTPHDALIDIKLLFDSQGVLSRHHRRFHARARLTLADEHNVSLQDPRNTFGG